MQGIKNPPFGGFIRCPHRLIHGRSHQPIGVMGDSMPKRNSTKIYRLMQDNLGFLLESRPARRFCASLPPSIRALCALLGNARLFKTWVPPVHVVRLILLSSSTVLTLPSFCSRQAGLAGDNKQLVELIGTAGFEAPALPCIS